MTEREQKEQKIRDLKSRLTDTSSPVGDWRMAKYIEYEKNGKELPFNFGQYSAERQAIRDEINTLEQELLKLKEE